MKKPFYLNLWVVAGLIFAIGVVAIAGTVPAKLLLDDQKTDLNSEPPAQVFSRIFHIAPPAGVSEIKVVGESNFGGFFWMRLQVSDVDSVMGALKRNPTVPVVRSSPYMADTITQKDIDKYPPAAAIGWNYALQIKQPECYEFASRQPDSDWTGIVIVDRTYRIIYLQGQLL